MLFTFDDIRAGHTQNEIAASMGSSAGLLYGTYENALTTFDIFLSHSFSDAQLNAIEMFGLRTLLKDLGHSVYVDWVVDPQLSREHVSEETAVALRNRMDHSRCLFFATSENSSNSRWMPWELGYMDAKVGRVAILPVVEKAVQVDYLGVEYLGMYPWVDITTHSDGSRSLWVNRKNRTVPFGAWLDGHEPMGPEQLKRFLDTYY